MRHAFRFKVNFTGGIISPGSLINLLIAVEAASISELRFGLRQQVLIDASLKNHLKLADSLKSHGIYYEVNKDDHPNILSSYPAEGIFIKDSWVKEGVYKDIFDLFDYKPELKINISDGGQTFTPFFTGNINWIASRNPHFWYLYIRFPKTNTLYSWKELIYTNEIPRLSRYLEEMIQEQSEIYCKNNEWDGKKINENLNKHLNILSKPVDKPLELPQFKLPYYEGYNSYGNKSWLGLYQRGELFSVAFLKDICSICMDTKIGQLYTTSWKSLIIKNIEEKHRPLWNFALNKHQINVRHASNELNWQVEDTNEEGLTIKHFITRQFDKEDVRTFGLCLAIKTHPNSGLFGSVIVRKQFNLIRGKLKSLDKYDILYTEDFNPNSKNYLLYRTGIQKEHLAIYLISLFKFYYELQCTKVVMEIQDSKTDDEQPGINIEKIVHECQHCGTVYDEEVGEPELNILPGFSFSALPDDYRCPLCESVKADFQSVQKSSLLLQSV